jgi:hypothetical protein
MARRRWTRSFLGATVAAAGTAAAQLGIGYGVGVISFATTESADQVLSAGLTWAVWITATSVVVGAVIGNRLSGDPAAGVFGRLVWRLVISLAAAIGGLVAIPLVAVPASRVRVADNFAPHLLAGVYVAIGVVAGLVLAILALSARAIAANVFASATWLWALAIVAVVNSASGGKGLGFAQLAVWKFTDSGPVWRQFYVPGAMLALGAALLAGGLAAFAAAVRRDRLIGVAVSGAAGPALVLLAYAMTRPSAADATFEQISAAATAPFMLITGLIGSSLVAAVGGLTGRPKRTRTPKPAPGAAPTSPPPAAPTSPSPGPPPPPVVSAKASVPLAARATPTTGAAPHPTSPSGGGLYGQRR